MNMKKFGSVDLKYLLLEHYRKLNITEEELVVVMMMMHLIDNGNKFISNDLLALKMSFSAEKIDDLMCSLINKKMIEFKESSSGGLKTSLDPLYEALYKEFTTSIVGNNITMSKEEKEKLKSLYNEISKTFNRKLAPAETQRIDEWVLELNYSYEEIEYNLKQAKIKGILSIKYIDQLLFNSKKREDINKEGFTFRDQNINEDVDKVIEVLKTKWISSKDNGKK